MRYLITGACGFIGSYLTEALLAGGHHVTGLDDLSTGRLENLSAVTGHPRLALVKGSVTDAALTSDLACDADVVFHLAAAVGSFVIRDRTLESLRTNVTGSENVIDAASRHGARLVIASTSEIYGKNDKIGLREDDDRVLGSPLKSRWSYAEAKAIDESLTEAYVRERGLRAVIVRLFNTVGPRQSGYYGMVIPRFVRQALAGQPVTVFGTGEQIRCFCHVHDVIPALIRLAGCTAALGRAVNIGTSQQVSINDLAHRVIAATGSASRIARRSYLEAYGDGYEDMQRRVPDCTLARELIGFSPARTLDEIIQSVISDQLAARPVTAPAARLARPGNRAGQHTGDRPGPQRHGRAGPGGHQARAEPPDGRGLGVARRRPGRSAARRVHRAATLLAARTFQADCGRLATVLEHQPRHRDRARPPR
jgi:UDP-glucose 4-epimerase